MKDKTINFVAVEEIAETKQIQLYTSEDGEVSVEVTQDAETLWLSQMQMAELFGTKRPAITKHLSNIFKSGELDQEVVCSVLEHTTEHGAIKGKTQTTRTKHYNLDAIISVGYCIEGQFQPGSTRKVLLIN